MTNLEQIRAQHAFKAAAAVAPAKHKDYSSLAGNLPAMFQNNGLLATWAFLLSKHDKDQHSLMLQALLQHFQHEHFNLIDAGPLTPQKVFVDHWTHQNRYLNGEKLMQLTAEAVAFSGWLKRAAEALCNQ